MTENSSPILDTTVTVVTHSDEDIARLARDLFAREVYGSRKALAAYEADKDRQSFWAEEAERWAADKVRARQADGENVVYVRVSVSENRQSITTRRVA